MNILTNRKYLVAGFFLAFLLSCHAAHSFAFDCARTLCGCSSPVTLKYKTTVVDKNQIPIKNIQLYCGDEKESIATSAGNGKAQFSIETMYSPGCHYERCTDIKFIDPRALFYPLEATVYETNGKETTLFHEIQPLKE